MISYLGIEGTKMPAVFAPIGEETTFASEKQLVAEELWRMSFDGWTVSLCKRRNRNEPPLYLLVERWRNEHGADLPKRRIPLRSESVRGTLKLKSCKTYSKAIFSEDDLTAALNCKFGVSRVCEQEPSGEYFWRYKDNVDGKVCEIEDVFSDGAIRRFGGTAVCPERYQVSEIRITWTAVLMRYQDCFGEIHSRVVVYTKLPHEQLEAELTRYLLDREARSFSELYLRKMDALTRRGGQLTA